MKTQQNIMKENRTETPQKYGEKQALSNENKVTQPSYPIKVASSDVMLLRD
ncbi:MAG: hypothetical protein LBL74_07455 [Bacteroidales bacterium]|jgi:hypothetical protein|nr:hypothetical protein [Bacteroidales bacterium]